MKNEITDLTLKYFKARDFYFWKWAEGGMVIEWSNGGTICYREDLVQILKKLEPYGFASLDAILLVLAACQNNWAKETDKQKNLIDVMVMLRKTLDEDQQRALNRHLIKSSRGAKMIAELPKEQRKGENRVHLLHALFSNTQFRLPPAPSKQILAVFETGKYDDIIFNQKQGLSADKFKLDLGTLIDVFSPYKNVEELSNQLKTGLKNIPEPEDFELPEQETESLLGQLAKDDKTVGLANLTQRLMASLHIPMHTSGVSDQAYGGISDITNRGDFDRLLLSELAYDETSLIARLVNNEALYYHHESPPVQEYQHRHILLDTTMKMWGMPRIFGLSAALACTQNVKEDIEIATFSLAGKSYQKMDLSTKDGVLKAMEELDAHLDCRRALVDFFEQQNTEEGIENVLVTTEDAFKSRAFHPHLAFLQQQLDYLITVNRSGGLQFFQFNHGKRKLLNSLQLDLKEHLFPPKKVERKHHVDKRLPAFFRPERAPLFFPMPSSKLIKNNTFNTADGTVITITNSNRLLLWSPHDNKGAREVLSYIESGLYYFGTHSNKVYLLVHRQKLVKFYEIDLTHFSVISKDYSEQVQIQYQGANFINQHFYISTHPNSFLIDCETKEVLEQPFYEMRKQLGNVSSYRNSVNFALVRKRINSSYSTLQKPKRVYIGTSGYLTIGSHQLQIFNKSLHFIDKTFDKNKVIYPVEKIEETGMLDNPNVKFCRSVFADGSEAIMDSRGLLHLRSSNKKIGETTIVMIIGQATAACFTSIGTTVCGNRHFYNHIASPRTEQHFYDKFIQPFIDEIRKNTK